MKKETTHSSNRFMKRLYGPKEFYRQLASLFNHVSDLRDAGKAKRVNKEFMERIMMAVTEVNGCRLCSYYHTQAALKAGLEKGEVDRLLSGDLEHAPEIEIAALYFAQHYAESGGYPQKEALVCLEKEYGEDIAKDILAYIRMIMIGNSMGNTFDAFQSRINGEPVDGSTLGKEMGVLLGMIWMIPVILIKKMFKKT